MKPLHIVLLVAAGAIGGALIMKVVQKPRTAEPAGVVSQVQAPPATAPATPPAEPAEAQAPTRAGQSVSVGVPQAGARDAVAARASRGRKPPSG